jgi:type IX secretion system PorP/SprF family membrane protein
MTGTLMIRKTIDALGHYIMLLSLPVVFSCVTLHGQDIHFSLFNTCPLYLNPANTGNFNGDWRLSGIYRNQWSALAHPFSTAAAGFDKQVYWLNQHLSFGLAFINDESGSLSLSLNELYGSLGYARSIRHHEIRIGLQIGYVLRSLNYSNLTLPNQWDQGSGVFNGSLSSGEVNLGERKSYPDCNIGLLWKKKIKILEPEIGLSFSHLNRPNESLFNDTERLPVRSTLHAALKTHIREQLYVQPTLLYMNQKGATETIVGLVTGFNVFGQNSGVKELNAGISLRNGFFNQSDAIALSVGATIRRFDFAICYDYSVSGLKSTAGSLGAFEISLQYKSISTFLNSYSIPCERF